ncbi:helix-turn-helix domain-containing protein [Actinocatenispora thailandica]|uniref:helix-turn-helix domain-containing protein n=1 Tax=Actinocatenispora thailandica TaxID=227318 RepID=UPI001951A7A8|nr:helix-turn-helix transcriptional regulator [Actinocatenispora thailandica]
MTLKELRDRSGKDLKEVSTAVERTSTWLSRAERAEMTPGPNDLKALLVYYGLDPESAQVQAIQSVAKLARGRGGWWHSYSDYMPKEFGNFVGLETAASLLREYEDSLVPGLLQTDDYAQAVLLAGQRAPTEADIREKLAVRAHRQRLLDVDDPPELRVVLDEGSIRREVGGADVMRGQVDHLLDMSRRSNIKIQVLPFRSGAHPGLDGPFTIIDFPPPPEGYPDTAQPRLIYIESMMNAWYLEKPEEIIAYDNAWDDIRSLALTPSDSVELLRRIADDLSR